MALALSEQTLAKILIAGSGLSVKKQCKLLRTLANAVDPAPPAVPVRPRTSAAKRRAAGRVRWARWKARDRAGIAVCRSVRYDGVSLARLITSGWLPAHHEAYTDEEIGSAISALIRYGDLPRRPRANALAVLIRGAAIMPHDPSFTHQA